ncbi:hypothetical protein LA76x_2151 [Lysobacter antibioticus]|uniref:Uncharacterized protein n=1 Tax=Lysobacter antibioticus TaxID=84531 RepID=A0A0S2F9Q2_LYSAN|nr:hypothetical protein LA76x_2151 [Lysobacter antibioticus]
MLLGRSGASRDKRSGEVPRLRSQAGSATYKKQAPIARASVIALG